MKQSEANPARPQHVGGFQWPPKLLRLVNGSRSGRIVTAVSSGAAVRVLSSALTLVSLPLAVRYLGAERYGIWAIVSTTVIWMNLLDLGIANSLTNCIARAYALDDKVSAARDFTNALFLSAGIAAAVGLGFSFVFPLVRWDALFNVSATNFSQARYTIAVAVTLMLLSLPCNLGGKILAGYQEVHLYNCVVGASALAGVVGLAFGIELRVSMPVLFLMSVGCMTLGGFANLVWVLTVHKPWMLPRLSLLQRGAMRSLLNSGWPFFLIQVAAVVVFGSDNLVVSHYLGAAQVTPYNVTWRLVGVAALLQALLFPALWPAYAEAYARHDYRWIRRTFSFTLRTTAALNLACLIVFVSCGRSFIRLWAGAAAVPSFSLVLAMAVWALLSGIMSAESCLLAALNRTREQAVLSIAAAAVNLALSIALVKHLGSLGVIAGTILSYLFVLLMPQTVIVRALLHEDLVSETTASTSPHSLAEIPTDVAVSSQASARSGHHPAKNGLLARSSPMVVSGPCPGTTTVSSGKASTGPCKDCMIF